MIDGIRRKFARSIDRDPWDTEQELEAEVEGHEVAEYSELSTDAAVIAAATQVNAPSTTNDVDSGEYYKNILKAAIQNGGKYGGHEIPIPWLRMILAGLEFRHIDPEAMWHGVEAGAPGEPPVPEMPEFDVLFPSEKEVPTWSGIR